MTAMVRFALLVSLLLGLPLLGVAIAGQPVARYLEFPPLTRYVDHQPFSWSVFVGVGFLVAAMVVPFLVRIIDHARSVRINLQARAGFPWWGWLGVGIVVVAWVLAWNRFAWFADWQPFTFTPLWLGYILVMSGQTCRRTGACLLLDRPRFFLMLFPISAAFWWFFEYLNRFVQNWYYVGVSNFGPFEYALHATLPFSTVLPAVLSTTHWLQSFSQLSDPLRRVWPLRISHSQAVGWMGLILAGAGLMGIGVWPDALFPLVWIAPVVVITSIQAISGEPTILSGINEGDWRAIGAPAFAGLICGFFWEMWNVRSLAHWEYAVPYAHRFQIFEMPLLGYAGYLPFGLECVAVTMLFFPRWKVTGLSHGD